MFISHGHHDHLDLPSMRQIPGKPTVIVPKGFGKLASKLQLGPVEEVEPGDRLTIDRVRFEVVPAVHSGKRVPFGPEGPAIGCVVDGSRTVYFPGDTDLFPGMEALAGRLDVALLPIWGWGATIGPGHMDPERAAEAVAILRPRLAIPIHWGTFYPAGLRGLMPKPFETPGPTFVEAARRLAPDVPVRVLAPGESVDLAPGRPRKRHEAPPLSAGPRSGGREEEREAGGGSGERDVGQHAEHAEDEHHREQEGREDADGVNLQVRGLRGHHASPFEVRVSRGLVLRRCPHGAPPRAPVPPTCDPDARPPTTASRMDT